MTLRLKKIKEAHAKSLRIRKKRQSEYLSAGPARYTLSKHAMHNKVYCGTGRGKPRAILE